MVDAFASINETEQKPISIPKKTPKKQTITFRKTRQQNIKLISTITLKPHEHTDPKKIMKVKKNIIREGIKYPIVADKKTNIILDGHHRHYIFKKLKIQNIPVYYVNYQDKRIILDSWNNKKLTKQDVINKASAGELYPIKTIRRMLNTDNGPKHISTILPKIDLNIMQLKKNTQHTSQ